MDPTPLGSTPNALPPIAPVTPPVGAPTVSTPAFTTSPDLTAAVLAAASPVDPPVSADAPPIDESTEVLQGELMAPEDFEPKPLPDVFKQRRHQTRLETITVDSIENFLVKFGACGGWYRAANSSGLSYSTVKRLYKEDDDFRALCDEALQGYRESIEDECHRRAMEGWDEPVFSQKTGQQMGVIRKYDTRLLELMLKRHIPEYREKFEGEIRVSGGVLVAPAAPVSIEDFQKQFGGQQLQLAAPVNAGMLPSDAPTPP